MERPDMLRVLSILILLLWSTTTIADTTQGFYLAGGLTNQQMKARLQSTEIFDGPPVTIDASGSRYSTGGTLLAGYELPLTTNGVVLLEAGTDRASRSLFDAHGESGAESLDVRWSLSRSWFVAMKPGIRLSDGLVAYLSLAYHLADVDLSRTTIGSQNNTRTAVRTIGGTGVGLGLQGRISERIFIRGEVESIQFSRASIDLIASGSAGSLTSIHSIKPDAIVGRLILGYRF
jgi:opacity protein-like surface antigen